MEKLQTISLRSNPTRRKKRAPAKRKKHAKKKRAPATRKIARRFYIEVVKGAGRRGISFLYWTGSKLVSSSAGAKKFSSKSAAAHAGKAMMKKLGAEYYLARVLPA